MGKPIHEMKILVVEGNRHMRDLLVRLLRALGIEQICLAFDQNTGFQNLKFNRFDVIVTDHHGETVDGFEFARKVRASQTPTISGVPIVMMVQNDDEGLATEARDAGANKIVVKPFTAEEFYAAIHALAAEQKGPTQADQTAWMGRR